MVLTMNQSNSNELSSTLKHLQALVSFDTQNPPREITSESDIFCYIKQQLSGFKIEIFDSGEGCIGLLATRGNPDILFNFHIDTVPTADNWKSDPFKLIIDSNIATGLGACDIKGAAACMLSAAQKTTGDLALFFSSDEEHGSSKTVKHFVSIPHNFTQVIVAEPTQAKAVLAHRGINTAKISFYGKSGHASEPRALNDNAIHKAGKWISSALSWVENLTDNFDSLKGLPFNIGKVEGGIKANMIADSCELNIGFRPLPGVNGESLLQSLQKAILDNNMLADEDMKVTHGFSGPSLPAPNQCFEQAICNARKLAKSYQIPISKAVNFWTEASLFSQSGMTSIVYGPGNISQAHTANEWVELTQLAIVEEKYIDIIQQNLNVDNQD